MLANARKTDPKLPSYLIVGGGICGLIIATELKRNGFDVTIVDKGKGIGGRLATRRIQYSSDIEGIFDYGAQHFTVTTPQFQAWVDEWIEGGIVEEWSRGFPATDGSIRDNNQPCWRNLLTFQHQGDYFWTTTQLLGSLPIKKRGFLPRDMP